MSGVPDPGRLEGELVALREPRLEDAAPLAQAFVDDPELGVLIGIEEDPGEEEWRTLVSEEPELRRRRRGMHLVVAGSGDEPLGLAGLHELAARHFRAEASLWLVPAARGGGRGLEALRLLSDWAIPALGLQRLQVTTRPANAAMRATAERAGYEFEGVLRAYTHERGVPVDNAMLARLA